MLTTFATALLGILFFGVIFHAFKMGFTLTNQGLKHYAIMFAIIVFVIALVRGFTGEVILESITGWLGYMVGLLLLRRAGLGQFTNAR